MTTRDSFQRVRELFDQAMTVPEAEREEFLRRACAGDEDLLREVLSLLQADARAGSFLQGSAIASIGGEQAWLGRFIGKYRLESLIAGGGMGVVFRAIQDQPRREVAIKLIRGDAISPRALRRFELEAEVLGRLDHPGIAQIFEAGSTDASMGEQPYFVMELIDGIPLMAFAKQGNLSLPEKLQLLIKICDAIEHAHRNGIIHRDLKPANILVRADGQPKVLDFGVARITDTDLQTTSFHTDTGKVIGTLPYMSPEQVAGRQEDLDIRSDVYALGVLGYELLTGRLPQELKGKTLIEAARIIQEDEPSTLGRGERAFPPDLETIIRKCLQKEKAQRYESARDLALDLKRFLSNRPIEARPPSTAYQLKKFAYRNRSLVATAVLAFTILVAGLIVSVAGWTAAARRGENLRAEAEKVSLLNSFFSDMLGAPDVYHQGPEVKVVEVLDLAAARLDSMALKDPSIAAAAHLTLAETYQGLEKYEEAEFHYRRNLELHRITDPAGSEPVIGALCDLAEVLMDAGKTGEADSVVQQLRPIIDRPGESRARLRALHTTSWVQSELGNLDESIRLARECVELRRRLDGVEVWETINAMSTLGGQLVYAKRFDEAREILEESVALLRQYQPGNPEITGPLNNLGYCYMELGRYQDALDNLLEAQKIKIDLNGESSVTAAVGYHNIAKALGGLGRRDECLETHRKAIAISTELNGGDAIRTLVFRGSYGMALADAERYEEGEAELIAAYDGLKTHLGEDNFRTRKLATELADLYRGWGKEDQARLYDPPVD